MLDWSQGERGKIGRVSFRADVTGEVGGSGVFRQVGPLIRLGRPVRQVIVV